MPLPAGLTPNAHELYLFTASRPGTTRELAREGLGLTFDDIDAAFNVLEATRLVRRSSAPDDSFVAIAPEIAATSLLAEREVEVADRSRILMEQRAQYMSLLPGYLNSRASSYAKASVEIIATGEEVNVALVGIMHEAISHCWVAHTGNGLTPENVRISLRNDKEMMARGVELRSILQHSTRKQPGAQRYAAQAIPAGAKIRTVPIVPARTFIFDHEIAFLSRFVNGAPHGALLIRDPGLVSYLVQTYDAVWSLAQDYPVGGEPETSESDIIDESARAVLSLLADGHKDEFIARRLGISVRTTRRHVSTIMEAVGAESRFQAGVRAAQAGWLD